jgi:hypothetical protein
MCNLCKDCTTHHYSFPMINLLLTIIHYNVHSVLAGLPCVSVRVGLLILTISVLASLTCVSVLAGPPRWFSSGSPDHARLLTARSPDTLRSRRPAPLVFIGVSSPSEGFDRQVSSCIGNPVLAGPPRWFSSGSLDRARFLTARSQDTRQSLPKIEHMCYTCGHSLFSGTAP